MSAISPFPKNDDLNRGGTIFPAWWRWFNDLMTQANLNDARIAVLETASEALTTAVATAVALVADLAALTLRVTALEAKSWVDAVVDASYFSAATGSWTVALADIIHYRYRLDGTTLFLSVRVNTSTIGSTPSQLRVYLPPGYTVASRETGVFWHYNATTGVDAAGLMYTAPGDAYVTLVRDAAGTAFGNATGQFFVYLNVVLEVTVP